MTIIRQSALLPYSAQELFELVNDIESYPEFMDGCLGAEILQADQDEITARLELGKAGLSCRFTTRNRLEPPSRMTMALVEGPFRQFKAQWNFKALNERACKISLDMEFEFASGLLDFALQGLVESASRNLVNAVCERAKLLNSRGELQSV